ncbi:Uncharacterised protein [Serratia odorifera]|uniref:Uncharacterized protein n=1 Tax=Serratia odorifera TaxID=618 RepID=A0A3S4HWP9_SEROD|nr:Uncharacterised protein [Serratia odorifera]
MTARALAQAYRYARVGAHIDIGVMPRQEGRPVPGVVEQDIVGDQKLMLTAVPFAGRATFSHWRVDDAIVERGKPHIVINTGARARSGPALRNWPRCMMSPLSPICRWKGFWFL